ncbi:MAG: MotA/TolQ/ExbB proton channel family protein, partial [Elusimicrobiota bacterium]|nr:MotA/TolQ/ExbB proton channel family protein [Elusimicrobiota bacterium]
ISARHVRRIEVFLRAGTYAPIFGLLGTLIGVVQTLRSIKDPSGLGAAMSVAVATTFFGVFLANFFFLAIAGRLQELDAQETLSKRIISRGMELIKQGEAPVTVREKLLTYSSEHR